MWCFIDESWAERKDGGRVGVIFAVTVAGSAVPVVDHKLYATRRQWYGAEHAKDATRELKGSELLSNSCCRLAARLKREAPRNHCVAREILSWCGKERERLSLNAFAAIVFGTDPKLDCLTPRLLELPFRELLFDVSECCRAANRRDHVTLVMDQRGRAQEGIAISVHNFVAGVGLDNVIPYTYFAVSNVAPLVQVADICAYVTARRAVGDARFLQPWWADVMRLQWSGRVEGKLRHGFRRYDQVGRSQFRLRPQW